MFTPHDITKNSKILQKVKLIDMIEYSSFPVGYEYFTWEEVEDEEKGVKS